MKFYKDESGSYQKIDEEYIADLREGLASKIVGGIALTMGLAKLMKKGDEAFKNSGLKINDKLMKKTIDSFRREKTYEGKLVMKGDVPYVTITKGPDKQGELVKWTPVWNKA